MGFNKLILPDPDSLKRIREYLDDDELFFKRYWYNPDAITGSSESFKYVKDLIESYEKQKNRKTGNPR
jgi:hypothetical protein